MSYQIKTFDDIVKDMVSWIVANTPTITDLNPGSVIRSYCEAASLCIEELYVSVYLGFRRYLDNIQDTVFSFERKAGTNASANVQFSRTVATPSAKVIPSGTGVKTASGIMFTTTADATILANQTTSGLVEAVADEVGVSSNVQTSTILYLVNTIDGVDTVTNPNAATGGVDKETDYQYKKRFQAYTEGLGRSNIAGLVAAALSVDGITSASLYELFPPISNENVRIYVDDGSSGGVSSAKIAAVQLLIDGDGTEENPGYRSAGVNVRVYAPTTYIQAVTMAITIMSGYDLDVIESDINSSVTNYINNLGVGATIIKNELISAVMQVAGVIDCTMSVPSGNVILSSSQVGRVGTITVTV